MSFKLGRIVVDESTKRASAVIQEKSGDGVSTIVVDIPVTDEIALNSDQSDQEIRKLIRRLFQKAITSL